MHQDATATISFRPRIWTNWHQPAPDSLMLTRLRLSVFPPERLWPLDNMFTKPVAGPMQKPMREIQLVGDIISRNRGIRSTPLENSTIVEKNMTTDLKMKSCRSILKTEKAGLKACYEIMKACWTAPAMPEKSAPEMTVIQTMISVLPEKPVTGSKTAKIAPQKNRGHFLFPGSGRITHLLVPENFTTCILWIKWIRPGFWMMINFLLTPSYGLSDEILITTNISTTKPDRLRGHRTTDCAASLTLKLAKFCIPWNKAVRQTTG